MPGARVPTAASLWLWQTWYDTVFAEGKQSGATTLASSSTPEDIASMEAAAAAAAEEACRPAIDTMLTYVIDVLQLQSVMETMRAKACWWSVHKLGSAVVVMADQQEAVHQKFREDTEKARYELKQQPVAPGALPPVFTPPPVDHPVANFEKVRMHVCRTMLGAALQHKALFAAAPAGPVLGDAEMSEAQDEEANAAAEARRVAQRSECGAVVQAVVELCIGRISSPEDLLRLANDSSGKHEFRLALRICNKAFEHIAALDAAREARQEWLRRLQLLKAENQSLELQGVKLAVEKQSELQELQLRATLLALQPSHTQLSEKQYAAQCLRVATVAALAALQSRSTGVFSFFM